MKTNNVVPLFDDVTSIKIGSTTIHMDKNGRYRLNDFHRANGGKEKDAPKYFLRIKQAKEMISELSTGGILPVLSINSICT